MASSLSNLVNNLPIEIHKIKCKFAHDKKDASYVELNTKILYKCLFCNRRYQQNLDENVKERFANTYKFSDHDVNKFILLLQKGVNHTNT